MQSDSSSLDTLKDNLLRAVDADYNVIEAETVLDVISQLEKMEITREQLQTTRLGREINTIRQRIDGRKKSASQTEVQSEFIIEIAQRAKKLLRSWQGLLNTSQTDSNHSSSIISPTINGDAKPRLILKVKFNSPITKRKRDSDQHTTAKRKKAQVIETPIPPPSPQTPISPVALIEPNSSLPRLKTTQQLLMEMQMTEPNVLSTQTSTVNAILQKKIIDESLHDTVKLNYSALHHGRKLNNTNINSPHFQKQLSSSTTSHIISSTTVPSFTLISSNANWENGSSAGSPVSPFSPSSSSSIASTTSWPLSTTIPEPPLTIPVIPKKKRRKKHDEQQSALLNNEQSISFSSDLAITCASYNTVADLVKGHRRRILAEHDARQLEARPDLLLVPIDQLAFVYERERTKELTLLSQSKQSSMTTVEKLDQPSDFIALPFIDCPLEFDLILEELVVQHSTTDM